MTDAQQIKNDAVFIGLYRGHRPSYLSLFSEVLGYEPVAGKASFRWFLRLLKARNLCLATIDDNVPYYISLMIARAILGRKTVGILVRPQSLFFPPVFWKGYLKKLLFKALRKWSAIRIVSILPPSVLTGIDKIIADWILDPELWDLWRKGEAPALPETELSDLILRKSKSRKVIAIIGGISKRKDFSAVVDFVLNHDGYFLAAAGVVYPENSALARQIETHPRVHIENRWLEETEILSIYKIATFAWCRYSHEEQASSGVYGRAIQTGVVPIINENTTLENFSRDLQVSSTTLSAISSYTGRGQGKDMSAIAERNIKKIRSFFASKTASY